MGARVLSWLALAAIAAGVFVAPAWGRETPNCSRRAGQHAKGGLQVPQHVNLSLTSQGSSVLNFAGARDTKYDHILLEASPPLPAGIKGEAFELHTISPMLRVGEDALETTGLDAPRFSEPNIFDNGEKITFNLCFAAADGKPGTYTGQFTFDGPQGVDGVTITQTAQLKTRPLVFGAFLALALVLTAIILIWKSREEWSSAWGNRKKVLGLLGPLAAGIVLAGAAMYGIYAKTPSWGADTLSSVGSLIGTGFVAAGIGSAAKAAKEKRDSSAAGAPKQQNAELGPE